MNALALVGAAAPRRMAALVGIGAVAWAFGLVFAGEEPMGSIRGRATLWQHGRSVAGASVRIWPAGDEYGMRQRRRTTRADGSFTFPSVPAGAYRVVATSHAHKVAEMAVTVDEGRVTQMALAMTQSEAPLSVGEHTRVYSPAEPAEIVVRGYAYDDRQPAADAVHMRLHRTTVSDVLRSPDGQAALDRMGQYYDTPKTVPTELLKTAKTVSESDIRITTADKEGYFDQHVQLGRMTPGLYLVSVSHGADTTCDMLQVTDMALVLKHKGTQVMAYTVGMRSGKPITGSMVRAYRSGKVIGEAHVDSRGIAQFSVSGAARSRPRSDQSDQSDQSDSSSGAQPDQRMVVVASDGEDEAVARRGDMSEEGSGAYRVHAYTDRPIYRPGQRIQYKGIARRVVEPGARYAVAAKPRASVFRKGCQ